MGNLNSIQNCEHFAKISSNLQCGPLQYNGFSDSNPFSNHHIPPYRHIGAQLNTQKTTHCDDDANTHTYTHKSMLHSKNRNETKHVNK